MIDLPSPKGRRQILATSIEKNNDVIQTEQFTTETEGGFLCVCRSFCVHVCTRGEALQALTAITIHLHYPPWTLDTGGVQLCQAAAGGATGSILAHHLCITYRILNEWNAVIACFNT